MRTPALYILPRRSLVVFAALAILLVVVSYLLVIFLAAACVYLPWLLISLKIHFQTLAIFVAGVVIAASMLWSLIPRRQNFEAPGLLLARSVHTRLFSEIDNIAEALREPLPREVYLIDEPNAWVANRGGFFGIGSRRMGLGLPLLAALNISQFRAILAHEFAHYYGGDTKLGPWLWRAQTTMIRTFENMGTVGEAMKVAVMQIMYAVVFGILKWYWLLFLRAINLVSRRQEFRADEIASIVAGPQSLISGLQIVHGTTLAWPAYCRQELGPMLNAGFLPPITGGFSRFLGAPAISKEVTLGIESEIRDGKVQAYDSHPPLRDRIAAAQALPNQNYSEDTRSAWTLLENADATELAFLQARYPKMPKELKSVSWDEQALAVIIPSWSNFVGQYADLLKGLKVGDLFDSLGRIPQIAPQIRDPEGMLLTPEQRIERARSLLSVALGLCLVNHGWKLYSNPGELYLVSGNEQLNPLGTLLQLSDGDISKERWMEKCRELGIEGFLLVDGAQPIAASAV